jgi:tetratricopeptide (TPR) repeat protein
LNEGLASFYETLTQGTGRCAGGSDAGCEGSKHWRQVSTFGGASGTDGDKVLVGLPPPAWVFGHNSSFLAGTNKGVFTISRDELPSVSALVSLDRKHFYGVDDSPTSAKAQTLHYAAAWRLVHTVIFGPPPLKAAFDQYLYALSKGDEPRAAWGSALRDRGVSPDLLEAEYKKGIERWPAVYGVNSYAPRQAPQPREQPMTEAEIRLLWARVRPWRGESLKKVGQELDAALAADPAFAPAYVLRGRWRAFNQRSDVEVLADLRKAVELAPDDFRTTYALASYFFDRAENDPGAAAAFADEEAKLVERLRDNAGSTPAWNFLAWYDAKKGAPGRGLPFARKAIDADPACFECYDTAALLLYRLGRLNEAVVAQRTAVHLTPEGLKVPDMLKRLQTFEKELAAPPRAHP